MRQHDSGSIGPGHRRCIPQRIFRTWREVRENGYLLDLRECWSETGVRQSRMNSRHSLPNELRFGIEAYFGSSQAGITVMAVTVSTGMETDLKIRPQTFHRIKVGRSCRGDCSEADTDSG